MDKEVPDYESMNDFMFGQNYRYNQPKSKEDTPVNKGPQIEENVAAAKELLDKVDIEAVKHYANSFSRIYKEFKPIYEQIAPIISTITKKSK